MKDSKLAVKIVPYDSYVPKIFQSVKQFIVNIIPYEIEVEHVGSTGVVGLGGKGIVDILIIAKQQQQLATIAEILRNNGFTHKLSKNAEDHFFVSGNYRYNETDLHIHIHITFHGSKEHQDKLAFRDYLRQHPQEAKRYYKLKKQWSKEAGSSASKYTELKTVYINEVLNKARKQ